MILNLKNWKDLNFGILKTPRSLSIKLKREKKRTNTKKIKNRDLRKNLPLVSKQIRLQTLVISKIL